MRQWVVLQGSTSLDGLQLREAAEAKASLFDILRPALIGTTAVLTPGYLFKAQLGLPGVAMVMSCGSLLAFLLLVRFRPRSH